MKFHSPLAILLSLAAALSTPDAVVAQNRRAQSRVRGYDGRRKLKSTKDSACYKSTKAGCIGFTLSSVVQIRQDTPNTQYFDISYGNGRAGDREDCILKDPGNQNSAIDFCEGWLEPTKASAVGTVWVGHGNIGYENNNGDIRYNRDDYFFVQKCMVLRGEIKNDGRFELGNRKVPLMCDLFLHDGEGSTGLEDFDDTIHLRGYTKGAINARRPPTDKQLGPADELGEYLTDELYKVDSFWATVIGGTGRWAGAVGVARVFTEGFSGADQEFEDVVKPDDKPSGWILDLYATRSQEYDELFEVAPELPPILKFDP